MAQLLLGFPTLFFAVTFFFFGRDLILATKVFFVCTSLSVVISLFFRKKLQKKDWALLLVTLLFSGMTIYFRDASFIKWRPTVVNLTMAFVLFGVTLFKKTPFEYLLGKPLDLDLPKKVWLKVNVIWGGYLVFCGLLNAYLVLMNYSDQIWVTFKTFITPGLSVIFMIALFVYLFAQKKKTLSDTPENHL